MKTKLTYIILASALLLSSACQKESNAIEGQEALTFSVSLADAPSAPQTKSIVEFTDENGDPAPFDITLSVEDYMAEPQTKGTPISTLDDFAKYIKDFRVWGWYNNPASTANLTNYKWTGVNNVKVIQYAGSDYRPYDGADYINGYYPTDNNYKTNISNYRFLAIAPDDLTKMGVGTISLNSATAGNGGVNISFQYDSPDNGSEDAVAQKEVLAGYLEAGNATATRVKMTFKPILAAIRFKVSTKQLGRKVTINSIEIKTFYSRGNCKINSSGITWSNLSQTKDFEQTFDYDVSESVKGQDINDDDLTKTFFIIPQTGSTNTTNGTRIIVHYTEEVYDEESDTYVTIPGEGKHLLYGQQFEAGKTYVYSIGDFKREEGRMQPWVDFSHFKVNNDLLLGGSNKIQEENNSKFLFDFAQDGGFYEKAYFKVYNLQQDHWYSIEFDERLSIVGSTATPFGAPGTYACTMSSVQNLGDGRPSQLIYYDDEENAPFVWEHPDDLYNLTQYQSLIDRGETAKLTFKATGTEMWWQWDYSKGKDNETLRAEIYLKGSKIKDITPEAGVPTVHFIGGKLYNCHHAASSTDWNSYSSMLTYALDATAGTVSVPGELRFRFKNIGNGRLNVPLTNLEIDTKYKIKYKIVKTGYVANRDGYVGSSVFDAAKAAGAPTYKPTYDLSSEFAAAATVTDSDFREIEFTASAGTMYWVWELSKFEERTNNNANKQNQQIFTFSNVTIEKVEP